jgi:NADH dehydrogenase FAD-containing subunit
MYLVNFLLDKLELKYNNINNNFKVDVDKQQKQSVLLLGDGFFARGFLHNINYSKYDITQIYRDEFINPQDIFYNLQRNDSYKGSFHFRDLFQPKIKKIKEDIKSLQIVNNKISMINNKLYSHDYLVVGLGSQKSLKSWADDMDNLFYNNINFNKKNKKNIAIVGLGPVGLELTMILNKNNNVDLFDCLNEEKILSYVKPYYKKFILESIKDKNINITLGGFYNKSEHNHDKIIYCIGNKCNDLTKNIKINGKLQMTPFNNIYIGGDCIDSNDYIKNAQCAYQQGVYVAKRLNMITNVNDDAFEYKSTGLSLNIDDKRVLIQDHNIIPDGIYPDFIIKLYSVFCI